MDNFKRTFYSACAVNLSALVFYRLTNGAIEEHFFLFNKIGVIVIAIIGIGFYVIARAEIRAPWLMLACAIEKAFYTVSGIIFVVFNLPLIAALYKTDWLASAFLSGFAVIDGTYMILFFCYYLDFSQKTRKISVSG